MHDEKLNQRLQTRTGRR